MSEIRLFHTTYEECKKELIEFKNANRDIERDEAYFDWRYLGRPHTRKPVIVWAETTTGEKIGSLSLIPHHFMVDNVENTFGILGDISVSTNWRGKGIATKMFRYLSELEQVQELGLCLVLPNENAARALKKSGWKTITKLYRYVKICDLKKMNIQQETKSLLSDFVSLVLGPVLRLLTYETFFGKSNIYKGELISHFDERFNKLWDNTNKKNHFIGFRNKGYLEWRYSKHPIIKYQIFVLTAGIDLYGYLTFHINNEKCYIDDFLSLNNKCFVYLFSSFLRHIKEYEIVSIVTINMTNHKAVCCSLWKFGFVKRPDYMECLINANECKSNKQLITAKGKWHLTIGDKDA